MTRFLTLLVAAIFTVSAGTKAIAATVRYDINIFAGSGPATAGSGYVDIDGDVLANDIANGTTFITGALLGGQFTAGGVVFDTLQSGATVGAPGGVIGGLTDALFASSSTAGAEFRFFTSGGLPAFYDLTLNGTTTQGPRPGYELSIAPAPAPVPVPASLPLMLGAIGAFSIARRRNRA